MADFDYENAKKEIAQIVSVVETVPEALREKCFELLFNTVFSGMPAPTRTAAAPPAATGAPAAPPAEVPTQQGKKLPSNVLAFTRKYTVSQEELGKLFILDHDPLLPIYKLPIGKTAQAQLSKVMMVLLENGLLNNQISAPYTELRENIKEDGLFDPNFNGMLKRNHQLFRGAISKDKIEENAVVELTGAGYEKLAAIVKELGASA